MKNKKKKLRKEHRRKKEKKGEFGRGKMERRDISLSTKLYHVTLSFFVFTNHCLFSAKSPESDFSKGPSFNIVKPRVRIAFVKKNDRLMFRDVISCKNYV